MRFCAFIGEFGLFVTRIGGKNGVILELTYCTQSTAMYFVCTIVRVRARFKTYTYRNMSACKRVAPMPSAAPRGLWYDVDMTVRAARAGKSKPKEKSANAERVDRFRTRRARAASGVPAVRETTAAMELADSIGMNRSIPELWGALPESMWQRVFESQPMDSPGGKLLAIRTDPTMRAWSIERQCAEAGVDAVRLARMVSDVALSSALVSSVRHIHDVVHGVAESAKSVLLTCELCLNLRDGEDEPTYIEVTHPRDASRLLRIECPKCGGMGKTRRDGNPRAVETFLKLHGGLEENNAPAVQVNTQINLGMQHSSGVHRGQMLLEQGRRRAGASASSAPSSAAPIVVTATAVEPEHVP